MAASLTTSENNFLFEIIAGPRPNRSLECALIVWKCLLSKDAIFKYYSNFGRIAYIEVVEVDDGAHFIITFKELHATEFALQQRPHVYHDIILNTHHMRSPQRTIILEDVEENITVNVLRHYFFQFDNLLECTFVETRNADDNLLRIAYITFLYNTNREKCWERRNLLMIGNAALKAYPYYFAPYGSNLYNKWLIKNNGEIQIRERSNKCQPTKTSNKINLECHVCTTKKVATSFHNLDDLQAHLFRNHHNGPSDMFQFVCQNCEFSFATDYRLLRHEETCGWESRSAEDMEKIHYKLQMYDLLEKSLKHNMTKNQTSSMPCVNPSNIETAKTTKAMTKNFKTSAQSPLCKKTKIGSFVFSDSSSDGSFVEFGKGYFKPLKTISALQNDRAQREMWKENNVALIDNPEVAHSSSNSGANKKLSKQTVAFEQPIPVISESDQLKAAGMQITVSDMALAKATTDSSLLFSRSNNAKTSLSEKVSADPEPNSNEINQATIHPFTTIKIPSRTLGTSNAQSRTINGIPLWKQCLLESANDPSQINPAVVNMTNRIHVFGPYLHPTQANAGGYHGDNIRTYFSQFGKIISVSFRSVCADMETDSLITFGRCDSVAKCIQQGNHKILGQDFRVKRTEPSKGMRKKIIAHCGSTNPRF